MASATSRVYALKLHRGKEPNLGSRRSAIRQAWQAGHDQRCRSRAQVSKKTVSRVINQSPFVKEDTREKVNAVIKTLGFTPDPQARGLAFRRSFRSA